MDPIQCFWSYGHSDSLLTDEKKWAKMKQKGFCAKGKNEEITCPGDSGKLSNKHPFLEGLLREKKYSTIFGQSNHENKVIIIKND